MKKHALKSETVRIPCASGKERVIILAPKTREGLLPGILWIHGGGYVTGMAEMVYTATMASSAYGTDKDKAGGGLLASQTCMSEDIQNVDLEALRQELGAVPKPDEDYKTKYGFLF